MDFPYTVESQDAFDKLVKERLDRAKKEIEKEAAAKYADFDKFKKASETSDATIADLNEKLKKANADVTQLKADNHKYEVASVKSRIARELKLPAGSEDFLQGETEDEIKESADNFLTLVGTHKGAPAASTERNEGSSIDAALAAMAEKIG